MNTPINCSFEKIADELAHKQFSVFDHFISASCIEELRKIITDYDNQRLFKSAGIGKDSHLADVRCDRIMWIDAKHTHRALVETQDLLTHLKTYLNQTCFLGIRDVEMHFAIYESGGFYKRHLDQFKQDDNRLLTFILYLNTNWTLKDGGMLRLFIPGDRGEDIYDIEPIAGRLVCLRSDMVEHEVTLSLFNRYTLTGWFLSQLKGVKNFI